MLLWHVLCSYPKIITNFWIHCQCAGLSQTLFKILEESGHFIASPLLSGFTGQKPSGVEKFGGCIIQGGDMITLKSMTSDKPAPESSSPTPQQPQLLVLLIKKANQLVTYIISSSGSISGSAQSTAIWWPHSWIPPDISFLLAIAAALWHSYSMKAKPLFLFLSWADGYIITSTTPSVTLLISIMSSSFCALLGIPLTNRWQIASFSYLKIV